MSDGVPDRILVYPPDPVPADEELRRILPVIEQLRRATPVVISVDTSKPEVIRGAAAAGAGLINDVRALREPGALEAAAASECAVCLMHMQGDPRGAAEAWAALGHPVAPDKMALAVGSGGSTFADHGMQWDNSGKNGHYAPINWSN